MENKVLKKILVMAIVFVMTFSNCGLTLQALATSEGISFFGFKLFAKNNLDYEAYFLDANGKKIKEMKSDVNQDITLVLELEPKEVGYLKSGTIKAVTDEGEPNFEFLEILNFSTKGDEEEKKKQELVQADKPLLQSEQVLNTDLETVSLDGTLPDTNTTNTNGNSATNEVASEVTNQNIVNQNTVETDNTVSTNVVNTTENNNTVSTENTVTNETEVPETTMPTIPTEEKAPELSVVTPPPEIEADDTLVDEDNAYQEQVKEKEDAEVQAPSSSSAKIVTGNEILVENIIHQSTIYVKIGYKSGETLKASDLYKTIKLNLAGTYINEELQEVEVTDTDEITIEWTYTNNLLITSDISKISAFEIEGTRGTLVEGKVILNRECAEEKYLPIKETTLEIEVPQINGKLPIALDVNATKLKATKGQEINEVTFTEDNWSYNESTKTITIKVKNPEAVLTKGEDIYTVVLRYDDYVGSEEITVSLKGKATVEEYSGKSNNLVIKEFSTDKTTVVNIGELITYSIGTTEDTISKGLINANYNSVEAVYEAEFTSTVGINILTNDVLEEFTLKDTKEYYIDKEKTEFEAQDIRYKTVKFRYNEIMTLLDQGGMIDICSDSGEILYTLSKDNAHSQETCEIALNGDVRGVQVSFRNVVSNGTFTIDFVKVLGKCTYDKSAFNNFEKIESRIKAEVKYGTSGEAIPLTPIKTEKYFEKSYTRAEISMNKEELATIEDNDNVEIKIELNNNTEKSDLYINPEFEVIFPEYVQNVEVKAVNLLYEEGLTVKNITLFRDETNHQRMKVQLEGVQRNFSTSDVTNGTNILINAKIQIDDYAPRKDDQLKMYYFNQGVSNYQSQTDWKISSPIPDGILKTTNGFDIEVFSYKAPIGFITTNAMENYDGLGGIIESIKQGEITAQVEMGEVPRQIIMNLVAMNNTGNRCTDVVMLGRIPNTEATDVVTGAKLGTNRNTQMITGITQESNNPIGCDIYYSYLPNATQNINDTGNKWTKTPEDMSQVKSYAIVPTSEVEPGTVFKFNYTFQIPANLPYEVELYGSFGAFYNNHSDVTIMYESTSADLVGLVTEVGPKLEADLSVNIGDGKEVGEARYIKYTVKVSNPGSEEAKDVQVFVEAPVDTTLQTYTQENGYGNDNYIDSNTGGVIGDIGTLKPGEIVTFNYYVKTNVIPPPNVYYSRTMGVYIQQDENGYYYEVLDGTSEPDVSDENTTGKTRKIYVDPNYQVYIENKAIVKSSNFANEIETNTTRNLLVDSDWDMIVNTEFNSELSTGQGVKFTNNFRNISDQDLEDVVVTLKLPETVKYAEDNEIYTYGVDTKYEVKYDEANHTVTIKFDKIPKDASISTYIGVIGKTGNDNKLDTYFTISAKGRKEEKSYVLSRKYIAPKLVAKQTTDIVNSVKEDEEVTLTIELENQGTFFAENLVIKDLIPENLVKPIVEVFASNPSRKLVEPGSEYTYGIANFAKGEKAIINITGKAARLNGTAKAISNKADISAKYIDTITTNVININIEENPNKGSDKEYNNEGESSDYIDNRTNAEMKDKSESGNTQNPNPSNNGSSSNNSNKNNNSSNKNNNTNNNTSNTEQPSQVEKIHSITGIVWLDANKNNRRDPEESGIAGVDIELLQGRTVVDTTRTNAVGTYEFRSLSNGDYKINFKYDGEQYITAEYKGVDIEEDLNSDAMNYSEGIAVTNTITIADLNLENVNCGLQEKNIFDLKVDKFITKSATDVKGKEKTKNYDNADLAKIEVDAKKMKNTKVTLTYKIVVTNTGNVSGKALKLVDYLPKDMEFNENDNKGWYLGTDGKLYNESLKDENIAPGEKKEISLVLVRNMNTENTGVISNLIEIAEAESNFNVIEQKENNTSTQETIISIRTGGSFVPATVVFIIMALGGYAIITEKMIIRIENNKLKVKINTKKIYK